MNRALAGHLVDQRDRVSEGVLHLGGISSVDCRADVAQRAAKACAKLTIMFTPLDVLSMCFQR